MQLQCMYTFMTPFCWRPCAFLLFLFFARNSLRHGMVHSPHGWKWENKQNFIILPSLLLCSCTTHTNNVVGKTHKRNANCDRRKNQTKPTCCFFQPLSLTLSLYFHSLECSLFFVKFSFLSFVLMFSTLNIQFQETLKIKRGKYLNGFSCLGIFSLSFSFSFHSYSCIRYFYIS